MPTTKFKPATFRLEPEILEGLERIRARDGIPASEQVRRALRAWVETKGGISKTDRRRAGTRRRP